MYLRKLIIPLLLVLLAGCSTGRQIAIDVSLENTKNAEAMREVAENCRSVIQMQIGFIEAALGNRINELSIEDIEALKKLKELAEKPELSDYELGQFLGLKLRLWNSVVQATLDKYAPDAIGLLPFLFQ